MPLTAAQLGIWFAHNIDPTSPAYNIGEYIEICGSIDPELFEQALRQVVSEAETLRVRVDEQQPGEPRQIVESEIAWSLPFIDVSAETDPKSAAEAWMNADLATPLDLKRGPLFCFALFKASPARFYWYTRYHHIILDGFGMWLVARRAAAVYSALRLGSGSDGDGFGALSLLIEKDTSCRDSERLAEDRQYWREYLADRPEPGSFSLSGRPSVRCGRFLRRTAYLHEANVAALRSIVPRAGASLARVVIAATAIFQHRLTGARDLVVSVPVSARDEVSRRIPGMVSNVLSLRLAMDAGAKVSDVIAQTTEHLRRGLKHQNYQIADLRRDLGGLDQQQGAGRSEHQRHAVQL